VLVDRGLELRGDSRERAALATPLS